QQTINASIKEMLARMKKLQQLVCTQLSEFPSGTMTCCCQQDPTAEGHPNQEKETQTTPERKDDGGYPKLPGPSGATKQGMDSTQWKKAGKQRESPKPNRPQPSDPKRDWTEAKSRRKKPKQQRKKWALRDAILVNCTEKATYSDVLKLIKAAPALQGMKDKVHGIRKTAKGELLLSMQNPSDPATQEVQEAMKTALSGQANVRAMQDTTPIEILDTDESTTGDEVLEALYSSLDEDIPVEASPTMKSAMRGTQSAVIRLKPSLDEHLLKIGKMRIGWVVCRI
ncbi:hypothetical protein KR084_010300, partial [Drosophila pseudotakahashii]